MTTTVAVTGLLERAEWYEAISLMFTQPTDGSIARIRSLVSGFIESPKRKVTDSEVIRQFHGSLADTDSSAIRREYNRLFITAGACRANETDYERLSFSMTQQLADVSGFYQAFGIQVDPTSGERPDYIGTELEFVRLLLLKQVYAEENGWSDKAEITEKAVNDFIQSHLVTWIPAFCTALLKTTGGTGPYATAATLLEAFISTEGDIAPKKAPQ